MGNQQERREFQLGWLTGLIEGEGCITLNRAAKTRGEFSNKFQPYISITNTDDAVIGKAVEILQEFRLPFHLAERKEAMRIEAFGLGRVNKWLEVIHPHLVGKKPQADVIRRFIDSRLNIGRTDSWKKAYTLDEIKMWDEIHLLNANKKLTNPQRLYARTLIDQQRKRQSELARNR